MFSVITFSWKNKGYSNYSLYLCAHKLGSRQCRGPVSLMNEWSFMMQRKNILWLLLASAMVFAACRKGNESVPSSNDERVESFVSTETGAAAKPAKKVAKPMEQPASIKGVSEQILKRTGYVVSYNKQTRIPNWVAWHLTAAHVEGRVQRENYAFHEDMEVKAPRATDNDYYNSRFDRGHMCPAGDNKWSAKAMEETFLFTNICPQNHALNKEGWNDLEIACRRWAKKYGDLYIVCGPILGNEPYKTIGRNKVVVPESFFKVILAMKPEPKAIAFVYENHGHNNPKMFKNATTVDEVERLTGINFFPQLDDVTEDRVEAERGYF